MKPSFVCAYVWRADQGGLPNSVRILASVLLRQQALKDFSASWNSVECSIRLKSNAIGIFLAITDNIFI